MVPVLEQHSGSTQKRQQPPNSISLPYTHMVTSIRTTSPRRTPRPCSRPRPTSAGRSTSRTRPRSRRIRRLPVGRHDPIQHMNKPVIRQHVRTNNFGIVKVNFPVNLCNRHVAPTQRLQDHPALKVGGVHRHRQSMEQQGTRELGAVEHRLRVPSGGKGFVAGGETGHVGRVVEGVPQPGVCECRVEGFEGWLRFDCV